MEFIITESIKKHNFIRHAKNIFFGFLLLVVGLIVIVIALITKLIEKFKSNKKPKVGVPNKSENVWCDFLNSTTICLSRKSIAENDLPENLEYPSEPNDIYIFEIKATPDINELKNKFFCLDVLETQNGIYLISVNEVENGMTLWAINKSNLEMKVVQNLKSLWWNLSSKDNKIILDSSDKNYNYKIVVEEVV